MTALSQQDFEKLSGMLFGLDPIMALGLLTLGSGAIGWLLGPFAGNWAFNMMHRRTAREMAVVSDVNTPLLSCMGQATARDDILQALNCLLVNSAD